MPWLLILFIGLPVVEFWLLIRLGTMIGPAATILLVIGTGMVGAYLARLEGLKAWVSFNNAMQRGELPTAPLIEGFLLLLAGALLITPGILTDIAGFLLLAGPTRRAFRTWVSRRLEGRIMTMHGTDPFGGDPFGGSQTREAPPDANDGRTIEVDYTVEDESSPRGKD